MHAYLRVMPRDAELEEHPELVEKIRSCVEGAPGINRVTSIEPHSRGGFAVSADRREKIPAGFGEYFENSAFMIVI